MRSAAGLLPLSAAAALVTFSLFFGGSLSDSRLFWIGIVAVAVGFGWLAAGLAGLVPVAVPGRVGLAAFGLLAAFVCWNGVTMIWSITPDLSWAYLNRGAVYVGFALLGLAVAASVRRQRAVHGVPCRHQSIRAGLTNSQNSAAFSPGHQPAMDLRRKRRDRDRRGGRPRCGGGSAARPRVHRMQMQCRRACQGSSA